VWRLWQQPCSSIGSGGGGGGEEQQRDGEEQSRWIRLSEGLVNLTGVKKNKDYLDMHQDRLATNVARLQKVLKGRLCFFRG